MARHNKGINVKVPRVKVIKALEKALVQLDNDYKNQEANDAKYKAAKERWQKQVIKLATSKLNAAKNIRVHTRHDDSINIDFDLPKDKAKLPEEPQRDFPTILDWQYKDNKEEIENAIRILKMCEDELISTATYGGISKYL